MSSYVRMVGLGGLVEAWSKFGIQTMLLLSLVLQLLLFILPIVRRHKMLEKRAHLARLFKLLLWLAYQLADTTAIYVLGHMAISSSNPSGDVMGLWASCLLVHLGGQDTMTAYSLEDNRLWKRHLLTMVVQVAGVVYVLPLDGGEGVASFLVLTAGVYKYVERIWVLQSSDMTKLFMRYVDHNHEGRQGDYTAPDAIGQDSLARAEEDLEQAHELVDFCLCQCVDYNKVSLSPYQKSVIRHYATQERLFELVHLQLSLMHDLLYTKVTVWIVTGPVGTVFRLYSLFVTAYACIVLFLSDTRSGKPLDVAVTYILLVGTFLLETANLLKAAGSTWTCQMLRIDGDRGLDRAVKRCRRLVRAAERSQSPGYIGGRSPTEFCRIVWWTASGQKDPETSLVVDEIEAMVTAYMRMDHKELMNSRGGLSLDRLQLSSLKVELEQLEFDEYLVIWYYATCEFTKSLPSPSRLRRGVDQLSSYMMYLFKKKPHMLPSPIRQKTCPNLSEEDRAKEDSVYQKLMTKLLPVHSTPEGRERKLKTLLLLWVEMLCYAASHCNWESHARELSDGLPEFATVLWVLRAALINANTPDPSSTRRQRATRR